MTNDPERIRALLKRHGYYQRPEDSPYARKIGLTGSPDFAGFETWDDAL